jgi:hypothetical protein
MPESQSDTSSEVDDQDIAANARLSPAIAADMRAVPDMNEDEGARDNADLFLQPTIFYVLKSAHCLI